MSALTVLLNLILQSAFLIEPTETFVGLFYTRQEPTLNHTAKYILLLTASFPAKTLLLRSSSSITRDKSLPEPNSEHKRQQCENAARMSYKAVPRQEISRGRVTFT